MSGPGLGSLGLPVMHGGRGELDELICVPGQRWPWSHRRQAAGGPDARHARTRPRAAKYSIRIAWHRGASGFLAPERPRPVAHLAGREDPDLAVPLITPCNQPSCGSREISADLAQSRPEDTAGWAISDQGRSVHLASGGPLPAFPPEPPVSPPAALPKLETERRRTVRRRALLEVRNMAWFWLNIPLMALIFGAVCGIPVWLVHKHPEHGPESDRRAQHRPAGPPGRVCRAGHGGGPSPHCARRARSGVTRASGLAERQRCAQALRQEPVTRPSTTARRSAGPCPAWHRRARLIPGRASWAMLADAVMSATVQRAQVHAAPLVRRASGGEGDIARMADDVTDNWTLQRKWLLPVSNLASAYGPDNGVPDNGGTMGLAGPASHRPCRQVTRRRERTRHITGRSGAPFRDLYPL